MKNLIILLFLGLTPTFCLSQQPSSLSGQTGFTNGLINTNNRYNSIPAKGDISYGEALKEYEMISGSPFLHGGEITVDIIMANDSILKSTTILYDLYNQEVIVKQKNGNTIILDQLHYKGFIYNNKGVEEKYFRIHPTDRKFYLILFQNEDFIFCKLDEKSVVDDSRHVPGQEMKKKRFSSRTNYYMYSGKEVNKTFLKNELLVNYLPNKYKSKIYKLKRKLKIKKLKKEKDYLLLMNEF